MNEKAPGSVDPSQLQEHYVGKAEIAIIVQASHPVQKLTDAQVIDLLSGKIKNWQEVGGPDLPVVVVVAPPGNGTRTTVEKQLMKSAVFSSEARVITNPLQVGTVVGQVPGGIGPLGKSVMSSNVKALDIDSKILAPMILVTKGTPTADQQKLINAIKEIRP